MDSTGDGVGRGGVVGWGGLITSMYACGTMSCWWVGGGGRNNVPCTCKHVSCYAMTSSLALAARCHATL